MRRRMTNVLTLAVRNLKDSTSLNSSKKRKMAKKTCLTLGSARNRKRRFRSCEPEWPPPSSQRSVQEWKVSVCLCAVVLKEGTKKAANQSSGRLRFASVKGVKYNLIEWLAKPFVNTGGGTNRKETITLQYSSQNTQKQGQKEEKELIHFNILLSHKGGWNITTNVPLICVRFPILSFVCVFVPFPAFSPSPSPLLSFFWPNLSDSRHSLGVSQGTGGVEDGFWA